MIRLDSIAERIPSACARRLPADARRTQRWLVRGLMALVTAAVFMLLSFSLLAAADFANAPPPHRDLTSRALWVWHHGNRVHFAVHILAGRVLDVCPCTRGAAHTQYYRALFHVLTARQHAVALNTRPSTPAQWLDFVTGPFLVALDWIVDAFAWLHLGALFTPRL